MPRSAQSLLPPPQAVVRTAIGYTPDGPRPREDLRTPAESVQVVAVWTGVVVFCLAFWAAVTMLFVS